MMFKFDFDNKYILVIKQNVAPITSWVHQHLDIYILLQLPTLVPQKMQIFNICPENDLHTQMIVIKELSNNYLSIN